MDYGRLAYLKADELESRLSALSQNTNDGSAVYTVSPLFDFTTGEFVLSELAGRGDVVLFCLLELRADGDASGKLRLKLNGLSCAEKTIELKKGETGEYTLMSVVSLDSSASVTLGFDGDATLLRAQLLASGGGVKMSISGGACSCDKHGSVWAVADCRDANVRVRLFDEGTALMGEELYFGSGSSVSICDGSNGFVLCYVDERMNVFAVFMSDELAEQRRVFICENGSDVSVGRTADGYVCAVVRDGHVDCYVFDDGTLCSMSTPVANESSAKSVSFVKNSATPVLVITTPDKSYIKTAATEYGSRSAIELKCEISVTTE